MKTKLLILATCCVVFNSCKKKTTTADPEPDPGPTVAPYTFEGVTFNDKTAYFSSDGSMTTPVDSTAAKAISSKIDLSFFFNFDYTQPGFLEPVTRAKEWYWNEYKKTWLSNAVETRFYATALTKTDFDAAKADRSKIATYYAASTVTLAPHAIFPTGTCIGGRQTSSPTSVILQKGQVFIFKNTASGKRGLLYIRTDQYNAWPVPIQNTNTKVDIIRES